ncbi:alpha/beta-hydrolase, partial [Delitschia confertaspora ATCC 74209]
NSFINNNPEPRTPIYPRRNQNDPSYTLPESQLRSALYIPPSSNSTGAPILFVPGTGSFGGINFSPNLLKLISLDPSLGQPYVLNIPRAMLDNIQNNVEYIAYAINYISSLTGSAQISVIGWSQGNLATQWVLKYWPSARSQTKQLISFSPDFHGTAVVNLVDLPGPGPLALPPAILQQRRDSDFIKTLRQGGGDSAYVPTTTIYSALFDEIVQPQAGIIASAYLRDSRGVGVSNNEIQSVCGPTPAGAFGTHESVLFNGLGVALALDALKTGGPADPGRLNLGKVCQDAIYPGLDLEDVLVTEGLIPLAGANILEDLDQGLLVEPEIRAYA